MLADVGQRCIRQPSLFDCLKTAHREGAGAHYGEPRPKAMSHGCSRGSIASYTRRPLSTLGSCEGGGRPIARRQRLCIVTLGRCTGKAVGAIRCLDSSTDEHPDGSRVNAYNKRFTRGSATANGDHSRRPWRRMTVQQTAWLQQRSGCTCAQICSLVKQPVGARLPQKP
jgi:hypothetical protein